VALGSGLRTYPRGARLVVRSARAHTSWFIRGVCPLHRNLEKRLGEVKKERKKMIEKKHSRTEATQDHYLRLRVRTLRVRKIFAIDGHGRVLVHG
jgi:hypothetical protein